MATPSPSHEFLRAHFENVFHILPEGHDKALKQAFYNTAATLFVVLAGCAAVAVYHIMLPFLRPLLWALLCGSVLFPLKYSLVKVSRNWIHSVRNSGTPLIVGTVLIPVTVAEAAVTSFGAILRLYAIPIIASSVLIPSVYLIVYVWLGRAFLDAVFAVFMFIYNTLGYFSAIWVWSVVCAYVVALVIFWTPQRNTIFKLLSLPIWTALLFHLSTIFGPFRVPIVFCILVLISISFVSGFSQLHSESDQSVTMSEWILSGFHRRASSATEQIEDDVKPGDDAAFSDDTVDEKENVPDKDDAESGDQSKPSAVTSDEVPSDTSSPLQPKAKVVPSSLPVTKNYPRATLKKLQMKKKLLSDYCLFLLLWSLVIVHLLIYKVVFIILPVVVAYVAVKKLGEYFGLWAWLHESISAFLCRIRDRIQSDPRFEVILPKSVRRLSVWVFKADDKIILTLDSMMDKLISIFIICLLLVSIVLVAIFAALEIHRESMHLVHLSSNLMNRSMHPELAQWLPDQDVVESTLDSVIDNSYVYGREWISSKMRSFLSGDDVKKEQLERQVLKLWDKIYESWFAKNTSTVTLQRDPFISRQLSLDLTDVSSITELAQKLQPFNLDIIAFAQENVGILISVLESIWSILVNNVALLFNVVISCFSLILGSGTAILNSLLEAVVFLTALFYLLSSSSHQYKPVELFIGMSPTAGSGNDLAFAKAFEDAIGSVFLASFKMAVFYFLYTWLTHTLFGVEIIFIPSVLAAVLAAVPFLGTYVAAIPAVIDLWLVNGRNFEAAAILIAHYIPTLFIDTAIYSEIKGGHPYMTGLAIAGGIYWLGLEGAIIGPVLLCCLIVAVNMYQTFLKPDPATPRARPSGLSEKRVKFNLLRGGHKSMDAS